MPTSRFVSLAPVNRACEGEPGDGVLSLSSCGVCKMASKAMPAQEVAPKPSQASICPPGFCGKTVSSLEGRAESTSAREVILVHPEELRRKTPDADPTAR